MTKDPENPVEDFTVQGDLTGRDKIVSSGGSHGSDSVEDVIAAKLRAKRLEAEAEARAEAAIEAAKAKVAENAAGGRGIVIDTDGGISGNITGNIGGSVAGRDLVGGNVTTTTTTGLSAADFAKVFEAIYKKADQVSPAVKEDVRDAVDTIKAEAEKEAVKGQPPDEKAVKLSSQALVSLAPDILDVAMATLASPAAGVAAIIRKVIDRARAMGNS